MPRLTPGDLIITNTSETIEDVCKAVAWLGEDQIVTGGHATVLKHNEDPKYLAYYMQTDEFSIAKRKLVTGTKVQDVSANNLARIKIPVPPLAIQCEIVEILDEMEALKVELESERELRSRQYAHYRSALLTFSDDTPRSTLGAVCSAAFSGGTPLATKREFYEGGTIPWLRTQEVAYRDIHNTAVAVTEEAVANSSARWVRENSVIVAISGAGVTRGRAAVNKIRLTTNQHCCNLEVDEQKAHYRYVFHWVTHQYEELRSQGQGNRSDLNVGIIKAYPIPLPSLSEQRRIADILDAFDALVTDASSGLPAEILARRQQYQHYRDRLMTFKEKDAVA